MQVKPDVFEDHRGGDSRTEVGLGNVVLGVAVVRSSVKIEPSFDPVFVGKGNF